MNSIRVSSARKIVSLGIVVFLLFCAPLQLTAQESPAADRVAMVEWFTGLWSHLTAWLSGGIPPSPPELPPPPSSTADNGCAIDPNGGCGG